MHFNSCYKPVSYIHASCQRLLPYSSWMPILSGNCLAHYESWLSNVLLDSGLSGVLRWAENPINLRSLAHGWPSVRDTVLMWSPDNDKSERNVTTSKNSNRLLETRWSFGQSSPGHTWCWKSRHSLRFVVSRRYSCTGPPHPCWRWSRCKAGRSWSAPPCGSSRTSPAQYLACD